MTTTTHRSVALCLAAAGLLASTAAAQLADLQPGRNFTASMNFGANRTENLDVGDVDLDGDLDVMTANGGDTQAQIDRIFINDGFGQFVDETATRFPGMPIDTSRDVDFVDIDDDGDLDVFVTNHSNGFSAGGEVSRFYVNLGGLQAGTVGFFQEETNTRWGQLAAVPAADQICGGCNSGPFKNWSSDADFADIDDDGDVDLFFSSYGPTMNGSRDSRVFLNDGGGVFDELWPWANATADTKLHAYDADLVDYDGDFDLDVFVASRNSQSRVYLNNLYGPVGAAPFEDITQVALLDTGAAQTGQAVYDVEFGDLDADADFDLWMVNYNNFTERLLRNDGPVAGGFQFTRADSWIKNDPNVDEAEVDFGDYDNDGDLDAFIANFSGTDYLYQSSLAQGLDPDTQGLLHRAGVAEGQSPNPEMSANFNGGTSLDGEWGDLDGDGDLDILLGNDSNQGNWMHRNVLGVPDTHAPAFGLMTAQDDKANGTDTVVHVQAHDNAPFYLHQFYAAQLVYTVDGGAPQSAAMFAQGGQQYRGLIPAQTDAEIAYHVEVTDLAGNTGTSATFSFEQGAPDPWTDLGSGLAGVSGVPVLAGTGPLTPGSAGTLVLSNAKPSSICALFVSLAGTGAPFKCGTLVPVPIALQLVLGTNGSGALPLGWASWPSGLSGASLYFQYAVADGAAICGTSLSNALRADVP